MTGWKNGWTGVIAHTLENLPWEESEGLPAEAAREPQAQGPRAWRVQGGGKSRSEAGATSTAGSRRHQGEALCFSAPQPPAGPGLFLPPSTGSIFRHKGPDVRATISTRGPAWGLEWTGSWKYQPGAAWPETPAGLPLVGGTAVLYL